MKKGFKKELNMVPESVYTSNFKYHYAFSSIGHTKAISSAFFSSQTGNKAVTVAYDNKIRIFDTENLNQNTMKPYKSITHNNQTGRWLTSKYRKKNS